MQKRVAVILAGCGVFDGAEIQESVLTLLALDREGAEAVCLAPNMAQAKVTDHLSGIDAGGERNVLVESARIARGRVSDLATARPEEFDAIILPGGFGVATNLSDFALRGAECCVHPDLERLLAGALTLGKPIGALCIAPAVLARVLERAGRKAKLTIGHEPGASAAIDRMGQQHVACAASGVVIDAEQKIVSSPCYMLAERVGEVAAGIDQAVREVLRMA